VAPILRLDERHGENRRLAWRIALPREARRDPDETLAIEQPKDLVRGALNRLLPFLRGSFRLLLIGEREDTGYVPKR
jgi:hypothetical protein